MSNIVTADMTGKTFVRASSLYQYDYGQVLKFEGVDLPTAYEVHFSNTDSVGTAKAQIGDSNGVTIPDEYLLSGQPVYAWVFLHTGLDDGKTEYKVIIPVNKRAQKEDAEPTPVQQDVITQAIAALNAAVESTSADADSAHESMMAAAESEENAKASEESAMASEQAAAESEAHAKASEQAALLSEQHAAQSEQNASSSEGAAGASQIAAARSAAEALASEGKALASEQAALASEQAAKASEDKAKASKNAAASSEATATQAAETATTKAAESEASAVSAEASRQAIENLTVFAETLQPGQAATVTKTVDAHGTVTLTFGIPEGIPGGALYS